MRFFKKNLVKLTLLEGDYHRPQVLFDEKLIEDPFVLWKNALVVKIFGLQLEYHAMREWLLKVIWKLSSSYDVMSMGNDYFLW